MRRRERAAQALARLACGAHVRVVSPPELSLLLEAAASDAGHALGWGAEGEAAQHAAAGQGREERASQHRRVAQLCAQLEHVRWVAAAAQGRRLEREARDRRVAHRVPRGEEGHAFEAAAPLSDLRRRAAACHKHDRRPVPRPQLLDQQQPRAALRARERGVATTAQELVELSAHDRRRRPVPRLPPPRLLGAAALLAARRGDPLDLGDGDAPETSQPGGDLCLGLAAQAAHAVAARQAIEHAPSLRRQLSLAGEDGAGRCGGGWWLAGRRHSGDCAARSEER